TVNWYDVVVVAAVLYGAWSGIRAGLTGEIIRVIGLVLMIVLAVEFQQPVGDWIAGHTSVPDNGAHLLGFAGIALVVYFITLAVRLRVQKQVQALKVSALLENVGGGFAGAVRMVAIMVWVTILVSASFGGELRSAVKSSRFGASVLNQLPTWNNM